jgi:iron complex transport system substrate-binding protein
MQRREFLRSVALATLAWSGAAAGVLASIDPARALACAAGGKRIVSIGGSITEILAALDAMCAVVATDTTSLWPKAVFDLPRVGYMRALSAEGIVALNPTVVLASDRSGPLTTLQQLRDAGVKLSVIPDAPEIAEVPVKIKAVGAAVAASAQGEALAQTVQADLALLQGEIAKLPAKKKRVLFLLSVAHGVPMAGGTETAADAMLKLAGAENIAAAFSGYKPMTAESVVAAQPDAVVMMAHAVEGSGGVKEIMGLAHFQGTPAGGDQRLIALDGTYLLGMGPRIAHAGRDLAAALNPEVTLAALPPRPWTTQS